MGALTQPAPGEGVSPAKDVEGLLNYAGQLSKEGVEEGKLVQYGQCSGTII